MHKNEIGIKKNNDNQVKIVYLNELANLPKYATSGSAGLDIYAAINKDVIILPQETVLINTGIAIALPKQYEAQIRSRSGLALKHKIIVLNAPGTIDSDYRGEIKIILFNCGSESYTVRHGDRIAQMIFSEVPQLEMIIVKSLDSTERNEDGFGSTGN